MASDAARSVSRSLVADGGSGGSGGKGGRGGNGGAGDSGSPPGSSGSSGVAGTDGSSGSDGSPGSITVSYDASAQPFLQTIVARGQARASYAEATVGLCGEAMLKRQKVARAGWRRILLLACVCLGNAHNAKPQARANAPRRSLKEWTTERLIDRLMTLDGDSRRLDDLLISEGFLAEEEPAGSSVKVHAAAAANTAAVMRELVRRGPGALETLLGHLDDARPTRLVLGNTARPGQRKRLGVNVFRSTAFAAEYDPRVRDRAGSKVLPHDIPFKGAYGIKVGDVCYALAGQIVNRYLFPFREGPDVSLVVNSPLMSPVLAEQARRDWSGGNASVLQASLLSDVREEREEYLYQGAMMRLRFYFPAAYNSLTGSDLAKRLEFEHWQAMLERKN